MGPAVPVPWVPEPKYELHTFPEPGLGPGLELLTAIMRHYCLRALGINPEVPPAAT